MFSKSFLGAVLALPAAIAASTCDWPSSFSLSDANGALGQISDGQVRTGFLGQIYDGQVRTGTNTTCLTLTGSSNGTLSDIYGRPCYVTPYFQFECTAELQDTASPYGFCTEGGLLTYYGESTFYTCDTGVGNQKNIYVKSISDTACKAVNLTLESAYCAPGSSCSVSTVVSTVATPTTVFSAVPTTVVSTLSAPTVYVTKVESTLSTVIAPTTVYYTNIESELSTVVSATTVYKSATVTVTASAGTVTETVTASAATVTETVTASAATVTETETSATTKYATVTVTASGSVVVSPTTVVKTVEVPTTVKTSVVVPTTVVTSVAVPTTVVPTTVAPSSTSSTSSVCVPTTSIYPNLIVPINSETPDTALGTGYWANITKSGSSEQDVLLQYDISSQYTGTCQLKFMFPDSSVTFPFVLSGDTSVEIYELTSEVSTSDTWNSHPATGDLLDTVTLTRGEDSYATPVKCAAGSYQAYLLKCTGDCTINYFIDYNLPPVGTVVTPCE